MPIILVVGCNGLGWYGKQSARVDKQSARIEAIDDHLDAIQGDKINQVAQLSFGVAESLDRVTNAPIEVTVAKELNDRVQAITGLPTIQQQAAIVSLVSDLISNNIQGQVSLATKDRELALLQKEESTLIKQRDIQINRALALSKETALTADSQKHELDQYTAYWGLGAVFLGVKTFVKHCLWTLLILGAVFILLRILAASNPIAGTIFGIFESLAATFIHFVYLAVPTSVQTFLDTAKTEITAKK